MGHLRERFNAKARQSTAGGKKRKRARLEDADTKLEAETQRDTNAEIIELKTKEQKEADRRERLRKEASLFVIVINDTALTSPRCNYSLHLPG